MIETTGSQLGIDIRWYVPDVVVGERRRQMNEQAQKMLPTLNRAGRLLGRGLISGPGELASSIDRVISEDIERLRINQIELDADRVSWREIIKAAIERLPPFEPEKPDKGFKDALILETFKQIVGTLPVTLKAARIFLVTNDALLAEAAGFFVSKFQNVAVVTREDLRTRLTAIAAHITQADLEALMPKAVATFYTEGATERALYYREKIGEYVRRELSRSASAAGFGASVKIEALTIAHPSFVKKEGQRLSFATTITAVGIASKQVQRPTSNALHPAWDYSYPITAAHIAPATSPSQFLANVVPSPSNTFLVTRPWSDQLAVSGTYDPAALRIGNPQISLPEYETVTARCEATATVEWAATLTQANRLRTADVVSKAFDAGDWKVL